VFLDRDGVLNVSRVVNGVPTPPRHATDLLLLDGVVEACTALADAGLALVVITNQPDIARGTLSASEVDEMHRQLRERLPLDDVVVCPHDDTDACACRKPKPGMILDSADRLGLDLSRSVCVGDRWRDIEAARAAGVPSVYIEWGHGEPLASPPDATFGSLVEAVDHLLEVTGTSTTSKADSQGNTT
jgi:D-glycero-D-manno-heptose 1,7-bisphosphate phosphatase